MLQFHTPQPGRYFAAGSRNLQLDTGGDVVTNQNMFLVPFQVCRKVSIDRIAIAQGAGTGLDGIARIGIYASSGAAELPSVLLVQSTDIDPDGLAAGTEHEFTVSQTLAPSRTYWAAIAWRRQTAGADQVWVSANVFGGSGIWPVADTTANNAIQAVANRSHMVLALGAWTELPSSITPASLTVGTGDVPVVIMRVDATDTAGEGPGHGNPIIALDESNKRWHSLGGLAIGAGDTKTMADGTVYWYPFYVEDDIEVERMALNVISAAGGSTARIGIYTDSGGVPSEFVGGTGDISTASTGVKDVAVTAFTLQGGQQYWVAVGAAGGAPGFRGWNKTTGNRPRIPNLGWGTLTAARSGGLADSMRQSTGYVGGALPDPAPTTTYNTDSIMPNVAGHIAPAP